MQLPDTGGIPCVLSNVIIYLGDHKDALQVAPKFLLSWHRMRLGFVTLSIGEVRYLWALSVIHIIRSLASKVTNELVAR